MAFAVWAGLRNGRMGDILWLWRCFMPLIKAAAQVRENAHAPYSGFKVGAAIRAASGKVYQGCNVENVAYPEGTCAEAGAIAAMCAAGDYEIAEVAVIADAPTPVPPCGGCRQKLLEFGGADVRVTMATTDGQTLTMTIAELLPGAFVNAHMDKSA
jgi:cytidine deaminase